MDLVGRLSPAIRKTLCELSRLLTRESIPFAVIGATALLLQDPRFVRGTRDLDLAIAAAGGVEAIRAQLISHGFRETDTEHRFRVPGGMDVDVLGFDPNWVPTHEIPQKLGGTISAAGIPESVQYAVCFGLEDCEIRIAPLSLLIAAKLGTSVIPARRDDLEDALYAMLSYEEGGSRRFELDFEKHGNLEIELRGALLAGLDAGKMLALAGRTIIQSAADTLMDDLRLRDKTIEGIEALALIDAFRRGLIGEDEGANP